MPYFVYKLKDETNLEYLETFEDFAKAKQLCKDERQQLKAGEPVAVRMVFAKNKREAESLLTTPRKPSTPVEEWEE